jgi:hypothetical protein
MTHFYLLCIWIQWVLGVLSTWVKQLGCEADHSPPPSAQVKNAWSYTSTPQYVLMVWCSIYKKRTDATLPLCMWHYYKDKFVICLEKILLLHAHTSLTYCYVNQIFNRMPLLSPTPPHFLLLNLLTFTFSILS